MYKHQLTLSCISNCILRQGIGCLLVLCAMMAACAVVRLGTGFIAEPDVFCALLTGTAS